MTFVLRTASTEEIDRVCNLIDAEEKWNVATFRGMSAAARAGYPLAIDEEKQELLIILPRLRDDPATRYLFCTPAGCIHLQEESYCQFSILNVSSLLADQLTYVKSRIRQAFRVGGTQLDGNPGLLNLNAVPDAQFIDMTGVAF
jgi:hypothetical protein